MFQVLRGASLLPDDYEAVVGMDHSARLKKYVAPLVYIMNTVLDKRTFFLIEDSIMRLCPMVAGEGDYISFCRKTQSKSFYF
jgi:hypothetical protein